MAQRDLIALGLSGAVVLGLLLLRKPPAVTKTGPNGTGPGPTIDPNLERARGLITTIESQITAATTPAQRAELAGRLEAAAIGLDATSPAAAKELRDAAVRVRAGSGGVAPTPPPVPPVPQPPLPQGLTLYGTYEELKKRAEAYLNPMTPPQNMDLPTLMLMDKTVSDLETDLQRGAGYGGVDKTEAITLRNLADRAWVKSGLRRPMTFAL